MTDTNDDTPQDEASQDEDLMDDLFPDLDDQSSKQPDDSMDTDDDTSEPSDVSNRSSEKNAQPSSRPDGQLSDNDEAFSQLAAALLPDSVALPQGSPDLPARSNAYISDEMAKSLPKLKLALEDAYEVDNLTKSLLVELSIRMAMKDVVVKGEDSVIARWAKTKT